MKMDEKRKHVKVLRFSGTFKEQRCVRGGGMSDPTQPTGTPGDLLQSTVVLTKTLSQN